MLKYFNDQIIIKYFYMIFKLINSEKKFIVDYFEVVQWSPYLSSSQSWWSCVRYCVVCFFILIKNHYS